ncbi:uncharacterized protein LOC106079394 [Biomphalaria glabrata]|uniref:Uncharacterized protein LOC106079394 n=1 Tax=Biomphalaria glabrata TaxID=6526 RepID=A0A9W3API0_BIOGL|nr:uncharacterized protein LOC106079394 [Biomphalaria glabrata]XP_055889174.1 uncharacterized protein LOC106079394 [Biomphalaria glabrata]XP_055889175.1 uncharacterized protein LOC106079394 [Biomphalaria glabrata]XP_055889176.1 uncharacterized protein LOC106079394 [Biomphalaria glabrata]
MTSMEIKIHPSTESPLTAQTVANTLLHLPQTPAILPFNSVSGPGPVCLFPVSLLGQPPLQSQSEPILLLPASSLPVAQSAHANASMLSPKMSSALTLPQQLLLNTAQLPAMIKPPAASLPANQSPIQQEASSQSIIVLPLGTNEPVPNKSLPEKNSENKCLPADSTESSSKEKWTRSGTSRRKSTKISELCSMRENSKKFVSSAQTPPSISLTSNETLGNSMSQDSLCSSVKPNDISQILSSLPPGWQVVGMTGLEQVSALRLEECRPLSQTSQVMVSPGCKPLTPSLVCVNLNNVSQPVASETPDNSAVNELTCCVKLDDIPCTQVISIKTEPIKEEETKPDSTSDDQSIKRPREKFSGVRKLRGNTNDQTEKSRYCAQSNVATRNSVNPYALSESLDCRSSTLNDQWTIVGVTSIPQTTVKDVSTLSNAMSNTATVTSSSSDHIVSSQSVDQSPETIILKIPICPSSTSKGKRKTKVGANKAVSSTITSVSAAPVPDPPKDKEGSQVNKSEDMKWTIVGLTQTPLSQDDTTGNIQHALPSGHSSVLSYPSGLTGGNSSLLTPLLNNASTSANTHLLNIMSAISTTNQLMLQKNMSNQNNLISPADVGSVGSDDVTKTNHQRDHSSGAIPDKNEWKVVGVTPLGLPVASVNPFTQVSPFQVTPFQPLSSLVPVPLLLPPSTSLIPEEPTTSVGKNLASATISSVSSASSPHPGTATTSSVILPPPVSTCLKQLTASDFEALQAYRFQHGLDHLLHNSSENLLSPINFHKSVEPNHWNVVGMLANNQVSLLDSENTLTSNLNTQTLSKSSRTTCKETTLNDGPSQISAPLTSPKNNTVRQTLASKLKCGGTQSKLYKFKNFVKLNEESMTSICKDQISATIPSVSKSMTSPHYVKKNTVSSLLRLKRMQKSRHDASHRLDAMNYMDVQAKGDLSRSKVRSLRSYAGNRGLFTKAKECNDETHTFSEAQVSTFSSKHEVEESFLEVQSSASSNQIMSPEKQRSEGSFVKTQPHSAARKRKLKVPRRMIAVDTDYHPFDTSSDSN